MAAKQSEDLKVNLKLELRQIIDNCDRVRSEIDAATESLIEQLHHQRIELFKELDNYEHKSIENNTNMTKLADTSAEEALTAVAAAQTNQIDFQNRYFKFNKNILGKLNVESTCSQMRASSIPDFDSDYNPIYDYDLSDLADLDFINAKVRQLARQQEARLLQLEHVHSILLENGRKVNEVD
jgi:hypothetical protein